MSPVLHGFLQFFLMWQTMLEFSHPLLCSELYKSQTGGSPPRSKTFPPEKQKKMSTKQNEKEVKCTIMVDGDLQESLI